MVRLTRLTLLYLSVFVILSCHEEKNSTVFTGTVLIDATGLPSANTYLFFNGSKNGGGGLWPGNLVVSTDSVLTKADGSFYIDIPERPEVARFNISIDSRHSFVSFKCSREPCFDLAPGNKYTLTLRIVD